MDERLLQGRYRIDAKVGQGAMGVVYRACDLLLERDVAVKEISVAGLGSGGRARLLREARAIAKLNHPNVVTVYDAGETDDSSFIVMELLDGVSLRDQRPRTMAAVVDIARQVCAALDHAHANGIIHRDLKPENVLITANGTAKLMDFGLARLAAAAASTSGMIVGTVLYMAPEQALGREIDGRADLYALGVMLYELVTGQPPFTEGDLLALISQHVHAPVVPPRTRNPEIPPALDALILRLLSKDPQDRPALAREVLEALDALEIERSTAPLGWSQPDGSGVVGAERLPGTAVGERAGTGETALAGAPALPSAAPPSVRDSLRTLIRQWRAKGIQVLDAASLALVLSSAQNLTLDHDDALLLIRSALHRGVDVEPWLRQAESDQVAVAALREVMDGYPRPSVRMSIVQALQGIDGPEATAVLLAIAESDDSPLVRASSAVEAARRGHLEEITSRLLQQMKVENDPTATAAFVAIADQVGLPKSIGPFPKLPVALALAQRRWQSNRGAVLRRTVRGGAGGGVSALLVGSLVPLIALLVKPEFYQTIQETFSVPAWVISGAVAGFVLGGAQGLATGFAVGLADTLLRGKARTRWRLVLAGLAGWVYTAEMVLLSLAGMLAPTAGAATYVPVYLIYGLVFGAALSLVIPGPGSSPSLRTQLFRVAQALLVIVLAAVPAIYLAYRPATGSRLVLDLSFGAVICMGLAFATRGDAVREENSVTPSTDRQGGERPAHLASG